MTDKIATNAPSWLVEAAQEDKSLEQVKQHRQLVRAKIVQGMSAHELKKQYGEGAVVMQPGGALVSPPEEPFLFVPLFMFTEYCWWSDINDKSTQSILERTFDPVHPIAMKSKDKARREETYKVGGANYKYRFVEHLVFPGLIYGGENKMQPITISFERGEYKNGKGFCSAITMRRIGERVAPLWSQVWQLKTSLRTRGDHPWWGFDYSTPTEPFIDQHDAEGFRKLWEQLREQHDERLLFVDHADEEAESVSLEDSEM